MANVQKILANVFYRCLKRLDNQQKKQWVTILTGIHKIINNFSERSVNKNRQGFVGIMP